MKILLVNNYYYRRGGSEVHFLELEEMLKSYGHEVTIFSMKNNNNIRNENFWPRYNDKKIINIFKYFYNLESKKCLRELLKNQNFDICHIHNINFHITYSIISELKKKNIPVVMTTHDYSIISPNYNMYKKWNLFTFKNIFLLKEFVIRKLFFSFKKNINLFICPSEFIKNKLQAKRFKKIEVMYNFCNILNPEDDTNIKEDYFLYFGRLSKEKGLLEFIKILVNIKKDFKFYIVGNGDEKNKIEKLVKNLKLQDKVKLLGYKTGEELKQIIKQAQFVITPSLCEEVCNMSIIESICLKKPVLAPNLGGNKELSEFNNNIVIYNPKNKKDLIDKLNNLMYSSMLNQNINHNIFTPENYYENLIKIYQNLIT